MRPPTEVERLAVFLAAMAVTRLMLGRPTPEPPRVRVYAGNRVFVGGPDVTNDPRYAVTDPYRARYGANNPGAN
ncbi:MAG: hypothetical protein M3P83_04310 [Actinomycetota bacterium]|nr:hypothetical protein [Actinomycetota bacterium]